MTAYSLPPLLPDDVRDAFCAWIAENGLDPARVSGTAEVREDGRQLTVREFPEAFGGPLADRTVPLVAPMPAELAQMLRELRYEC